MATISSLAVVVTARTGKYTRNMKKAAMSTTLFGASVKKLAKIFGAAAIGALALKTARSFASLVNEQFKLVDLTGKLSDELGIGVETLESYRLAAAITGTNQEALTRGLQRLVRRLGEAASGYGEAVKGVRNLGLDATKLADMKLEDSMSAIADGILKIEDPARRAAALFTLLGRQGQELTNFFQLGSKGLAAFRKEVLQYGTALSRVDVRHIENWNDAFFRSKQVVVGFARQVATFLAPSLEDLAVRFTGATTAGDSMKVMVTKLGVATIDLIGVFKDLADPFVLIFDAAQTVTGGILIAFADIQVAALAAGNAISRIFGGDRFREELTGAIVAAQALRDVTRQNLAETNAGLLRQFGVTETAGTAFVKNQARLRDEADRRAREGLAADATRFGAGTLGGDKVAKGRKQSILGFQEITSRSSLRGISAAGQPQTVEDKQLIMTNRLLRTQNDMLRRGSVARAG